MARHRIDIVNEIYDLARLEALMLRRLPARPPRRATPAERLAGIVSQHVTIGRKDRVMAHRDEWIDAINATQKRNGEWPYDPDWRREIGVIGQVSAALFQLGGRPKYRIRLVERLRRPAALNKWLRERNWAHPWGGAGHDVIGLVQTMANLGLPARGIAQRVVEFVEGLRQSGTGLLAEGHFDEPGDQQFGSTFAFGIIYEFLHLPLPDAPALVRFILSRQHRSGSWAKTFPGGSFNMDAVYLLSRWTRYGSPLRPDAETALKRLARYLKREIAKRRGREREDAAMVIAKTLLLLQEVFPSTRHRNRIWRYACDMTIHP